MTYVAYVQHFSIENALLILRKGSKYAGDIEKFKERK